MKIIILCLIIIFGTEFRQSLSAQSKEIEISALAKQILSAKQLSNDIQLKYSWTSRTEILKSTEILNIMIEKNQFDQQGKQVMEILNEKGAKMPRAFIIKEIAETEKENIEKFLFGLRDFLKKYSLSELDKVTRFIETATWQVVDSTHEFLFTGKNVEVEGDQMTWYVEDKHFSTVRIEINTIFENKDVHFVGTFLRLKNGLNYLGYAEATIPEKKITLQLQNYSFIPE
jgi:hypothetical protein